MLCKAILARLIVGAFCHPASLAARRWKAAGALTLGLVGFGAAPAFAQNDEGHEEGQNEAHSEAPGDTDGEAHGEGEKPHHLSLLVAGTDIEAENETAITLGVDYEYRVNELLGLGFVVEQAFGEIDSTTVLAVADIHIWNGFVMQVGPGVEFIDDTEYAIGRIGALYEFELGDHFTLSPQLHYDVSEGEDAIVFGLAFGRAF